jgi:hypothetical protein
LAQAGFVYRPNSGVDFFLDGPNAKARDAVHVLFAGERVREEYLLPVPDPSDSEATSEFRLVALERSVLMKLMSFRTKDCMHLLDMLDVGLGDKSWLDRLPAPLASRLQELIANPEG